MHNLVRKYDGGGDTTSPQVNNQAAVSSIIGLNFRSLISSFIGSQLMDNASTKWEEYKKQFLKGQEKKKDPVLEDDDEDKGNNFFNFKNLSLIGAAIGTPILDGAAKHLRSAGYRGDIANATDTLGSYGNSSPYASLAMAGINKATGGTDGMTIPDAALGSAGLAGALFTMNPYVGAAYIAASAANSLTGKQTMSSTSSDLESQLKLAQIGGSYGKTMSEYQNALDYSNKKIGGLSRLIGQYDSINNKIGNSNYKTNKMKDVYNLFELGRIRGRDMADINSLDYRLNTIGGYDQYSTYIGRKGMKLPTELDITRIRKIQHGETIDSFKNGGQMSVIPEGALHARLHHMETENKITKKGIPVIDKTGEQQAEIERNEIIFSLDLTNELESLRKDGSEQAAIKAGKLLVNEIFHNTDDRTGLIQEVIGNDQAKKGLFKEGGIIKAEKPEVEYLQNGGNFKAPTFVIDDNPRTDIKNGVIYYNTPESKYHEYFGHYQPDERLLEQLSPYWKDLNDDKLKEFGTDLLFVKRIDNDPNYFFNPQEVLGRIQASRYMLGDDIYKINPLFFIDLKTNDELKYGDNLRDLLHMYNPEILTKIFKTAGMYTTPRFKSGGVIEAEEPTNNEIEGFKKGGIISEQPQISIYAEEPNLNEVEEFKEGGIIAEEPEIEENIESYKEGKKLHWKKPENWTEEKIPYEEWIKDVNPDYLSDNYDLETLYNSEVPKEYLERWKWAVNSDDPEYYMNYKDVYGNTPYHLGSVIELDNGDIMFLKKGNEKTNKEIIPELMAYLFNDGNLRDNYDLSYEGDRYYYRKKNPAKSVKKENGGLIGQINNLSPNKIKELENILKYLNQ